MTSREKAECTWYQLREVDQVWYNQWKENRLVDSCPIEWEEIKDFFLEKYFPHERREVKDEEFINLKKGNISVGDYSLKFTMFYRCDPSMVSHGRDEMIRFMAGVADLEKEEVRTTMLPGDMNLYRLMVYSESIEESKISRNSRIFKRCGPSE